MHPSALNSSQAGKSDPIRKLFKYFFKKLLHFSAGCDILHRVMHIYQARNEVKS